jgi:hypothetical protein
VSIERGRRQLAPNRRGRIKERKQAQIHNYQDGREMTDRTGPDGTPADLTESRTEPGEGVLTGLKNRVDFGGDKIRDIQGVVKRSSNSPPVRQARLPQC